MILGCVLPLSKYSKVGRCLMKTRVFTRGCRPIFDHRTRVRNGPYRGGSGRKGESRGRKTRLLETPTKRGRPKWVKRCFTTQKPSPLPSSKRRPHALEHTRATGQAMGSRCGRKGESDWSAIHRWTTGSQCIRLPPPVQHVVDVSRNYSLENRRCLLSQKKQLAVLVFSGVTTTHWGRC